ncbi:hypothetical protein [Sulfurimonas sp.]|uniref:hypothetical protein n=1 Tax=Sulfurimonas sp. TaxID=2022749 RepID=UPI0025DFADB0|nr:hypothetical protein [Sulfurimonas sp.]
MIQAIISLFALVRGLFITGGLIARVFTWLSGSFGWIAGILLWFADFFKKFFIGTGLAFKKAFIYLGAYHAVEFVRKGIFITFILAVFNWALNYAMKNLLVYDGKSITILFNQFISAISSFGALGHNFLAFMSKIGFFDSLSLLLSVMLYTLITRVALTILFK